MDFVKINMSNCRDKINICEQRQRKGGSLISEYEDDLVTHLFSREE